MRISAVEERMQVWFGMGLDAGAWPEFEGEADARIGDVIVGPAGLIGLLETRLGLGGRDTAEALRIRQYMVGIQSLPASKRFYTDSFSFDAWASARELLAWRDELVLHGWSPDFPDPPERLAALAEIEAVAAEPLAPGLADRFRSVLAALAERPRLPIRCLRLQEPRRLLPAPWRTLLNALQDCGVAVTDVRMEATRPDQIVVLHGEHLWPMAQAVAGWLRQSSAADRAVLLCQLETTQLDQALHAQGLPATGQGATSAQLGVLQLLPLVLENLWRPVRIESLMELLSAPLSPVPAFAARRLMRALAKAPGLEGEAWQQALADIAAGEGGQALAQDLDRWLRLDRVDDAQEAPTKRVIRAIDRLQRHLAGQRERNPLITVAMGHCRDLRTILSGMDRIAKPLLDRIVDDVIGPGRTPGLAREAAPWGVVNDAAQLCGPIDTLIWWGFVDPAVPARHVWSDAERAWLRGHGVLLDAPSLARARERHHGLASLARCRRLLLCRPEALNGAPVAAHPLWADIEADAALADRCSHVRAMDLFTQARPSLLDVPLELVPARRVRKMRVTAWKPFDATRLSRPERLTPTSLGTLFGCSFKWLLETLGVRGSDVMGFPRASAMVGTLVHQVLEDVFAAASIPTPEEAARKAADSYAARVPAQAAELLLPENCAEYEEIRDRVAHAAQDLAERLALAGFERMECEQRLKTRLDGIPVTGRADAIAYKGDRPHIIDFKDSYSLNHYRDKIEKGKDVQLIAYARMLGDRPSPVAYYLIPRREFVTIFPEFGGETVEASTTLAEGWERVRRTYGARMRELRDGTALAAGVLNEDEIKELTEAREQAGEIHLDAPCAFCDFAALCGLHAGGASDA